MLVHETSANNFTEWTGYAIDGIKHPRNIDSLWSNTELAEISLYRFTPFSVPANERRVGSASYEWSGNTVIQAFQTETIIITTNQVNQERDRRVAQGFVYANTAFDSRVEDQKRIAGAGTLAVAAIMQGVQPGNTHWHGEVTDFSWIAQDNNLMPMDAHIMLEFGQTAAKWESKHVFAARALKDMDPIPLDYTDDQYWPSANSA